MPPTDPRIDAYIAKSAEFARPILAHFRAAVHEACPGVEETIKWGMPHFVHHGILAGMAAFKAHCAFSFGKGALVAQAMGAKGAAGKAGEAMGDFGRVTSVRDLPPRRELVRWVRTAMRLNEAGVKRPLKRTAPRKPIPVPEDLAKALRKDAKARAVWEGFTPSHRREYLEWITEAKTAPTRARRLATTLEWLAEGKPRHWKYR
jgi:uncharacterized protein YdeI (YjbR/CyaY-like superfamily)